VEVALTAILLTVLNLVQVALLAWIQRRTAHVRQEVAAVLEWARQPDHVPSDRFEDRET
jgi:hypothetical protein